MSDDLISYTLEDLVDDAEKILHMWEEAGVEPSKAYAIVNLLKTIFEHDFGVEKVSETVCMEHLH